MPDDKENSVVDICSWCWQEVGSCSPRCARPIRIEDRYGDLWRFTLTEYQIANLKAAIEALGYGHGANVPSNYVPGFNTGDWLGELYNMLAIPPVTLRPNCQPQQMASTARDQIESDYRARMVRETVKK